MTKIEICLIRDLFWETLRLIGRAKVYPEEWKCMPLTPIYKKGYRSEPKNHRTVCMISCLRKMIVAVISEKILENLNIFGRKYGFQRSLSPSITLMDVDAVETTETNMIATLYFSKAYDRVNRRILLE